MPNASPARPGTCCCGPGGAQPHWEGPSCPGGPLSRNYPLSSAEQKPQESKGVIIVAVIVCILVLAVLGAVLYFLHKKGKIPCGRTGKQDITKPDARKDEVVVEVKSDKLPEEAGLLQATNGDQKPAGDQGEKYIDLRH